MSQIRPITEEEIELRMALKKNAYPGLDIDSLKLVHWGDSCWPGWQRSKA